MIKLSTNSSNKDILIQNKQDYEIDLKNSGYKEKLMYKSREGDTNIQNRNNNRERKIWWFTPPYNMAVTTKVGREFF